mgnify:CR=1 FL=1
MLFRSPLPVLMNAHGPTMPLVLVDVVASDVVPVADWEKTTMPRLPDDRFKSPTARAMELEAVAVTVTVSRFTPPRSMAGGAKFRPTERSEDPPGRTRPKKMSAFGKPLTSTSRLSAHLHFGEISVRQVWHAVHQQLHCSHAPPAANGVRVFASELGWREFAHHLLFHFPRTPVQPLREQFASFPWLSDDNRLRAWQRGCTGFPIVDAGMRELWHTGWMHNRVRMIVASFLVKDLLISWQQGARWFWDTLVDADLANNTLGWQWSAGCGADAAPYFRVFNPVNQGQKFDPGGMYVRRWVPELEHLPNKWIHQPWRAPAPDLNHAGIHLGKTYPQPIVDHLEARSRALQALQRTNQRLKVLLASNESV